MKLFQVVPTEFESSVNPEGIQTLNDSPNMLTLFESSVNPEGIQTGIQTNLTAEWFESSVNPEGIQTVPIIAIAGLCLRAV